MYLAISVNTVTQFYTQQHIRKRHF